MDKKGKKSFKKTLIILTILAVSGFGVNWYLTNKLEGKLRSRLQEEVSKATDGFYHFSFENLSIGFFNGELSIKGVTLTPDSIAFEQWRRGDSLPNLYYKVKLDEIHFKGINLTWRRDYKDLDFTLFELRHPDIQIVQPQLYSSQISPLDQKESSHSKTIHEIMSPYIDVLTVSRINLKNATICYTVEDSISPVTYTLSDADLNAFRFRLDKDSHSSGNLLYCDNFDFVADKPQQLLHSDQLILNTRNIRLSTIDQLVKIEGVRLHPSDRFKEHITEKPGGYIDAVIESVLIKGIKFKREEALNYLEADSFDISSTDIKYHNVNTQEEQSDNREKKTETVKAPWSLYSVLSPIFQRISIAKIGIDKTKFEYNISQQGVTDTYTLDQFDFNANNFLVDSLSEKQLKFWYVDNFSISASKINGLIASNNSNINVDKLLLNTADKHFSISNIQIKPISTTNPSNNYYIGFLKSIAIDGLEYDTGVHADHLKIESPNLEYYQVVEDIKSKQSGKSEAKSPEDILSIFNPYAEYLSVNKIKLSNANIKLKNALTKESYEIKKLNLYANNLLIDEKTRRTQKYLFTSDDIGLSFQDFDNLLYEGSYRLKIKQANISTLAGSLHIEDVKLIPQKQNWKKNPDIYYDIDLPLIDIKGFDNDSFFKENNIKIRSLNILNPKIEATRLYKENKNKSKETSFDNSVLFGIENLIADSVNISEIGVKYINNIEKDSLQTHLDTLSLYAIKWHIKEEFNIDKFILRSPKIDYITNAQKPIQEEEKELKRKDSFTEIFGNKIIFGQILLSNGELNFRQHNTSLKIDIDKTDVTKLNWMKKDGKSDLAFSSINIIKPLIDINEDYNGKTPPKNKKDSGTFNLYSAIAPYLNRLSINKFNLAEAHINYNHTINGKEQNQQSLNTTNLQIDALSVNSDSRKIELDDIRFDTKDLHFPIMNGYYTIGIGDINVSKRNATISLSDIRMISAYPKTDFAYIHLTHMDWFDVVAGNVILSGVDYETYFSDNVLNAKQLIVKDVMLKNFKNKKIYTPPKLQPLIYTKLYNLPLQLRIDTSFVSNFSVIYEELAKKGNIPGKISFMNMNARIDGISNIASHPQQFMHLDAEGKFMGTGYFTAKWDMPISPDYDCFILNGHVYNFDLRDLNQIITPLAKAEIKDGRLKDLTFRTEASSTDAIVDMKFLYNDLSINILKGDDEESTNKFVTNIANALIRSNNPNKAKAKPRTSTSLYIDRDPYHSTFNYFWQILQPPLVESVGVSQKKQNFMKKASGFFTKVKEFFTGKKKEEKVVDNK